ncbi:unnamed protein product [Gongylonema pulchrum]|uniref:COesterase domain-containing protein n=1 Tax=Gongylonema pulchrum TaxID=637853 RepID=A0A183DSS5_9BILA|nr:unnamed protein product [Gongylonema pulchrum]
MYELGQFFQHRYSSFVERFDTEDIDLLSSNSDRAIVSAQAMLRGFFPADSKDDQWLNGELWQPLPFHTGPMDAADAVSFTVLNLLKPTDYSCPIYERYTEKQNEELFKNISKKYAEFFSFLANVTGFPKVNLKKAASLYNIHREIRHDLAQPTWVYKRWPEYDNQTTLEIIGELKRISRIAEFNSPEKARLRGGLLMGDWIARMRNVSRRKPVKPRKMLLYSAVGFFFF